MSINEVTAKIKELKSLQALIEEAEAEAEALKDQIKEAMGDSEELRAGDYKVTYKMVKSSRFDSKSLKAELLRPKTPQEGKGYIDFATALKWCNEAFFDGFMSAHYETADEWERMTTEERIGYCFMAVERCAILRRETPPELNFSGGGQSNSPYSLQAVTGHCRAVERGRSCMNGKHLPPLRIEPQEAIALFTHAKTEEMYRVKDLYTAYREARGTDTDSLWDIMSLLSFVYDTARIQGIREERARRA